MLLSNECKTNKTILKKTIYFMLKTFIIMLSVYLDIR